MCGIGSITISNKATKEWDLNAGAVALLLELDSRGKDACGMMAIREDGSLQIQKAALKAQGFISGMYPVNDTAKAVAVHTRYATKGTKDNPKNNHPVACGDAHIIHNGVVDDFDVPRIKGSPDVDTFALSYALWCANEADEGVTDENPRQWAKRVASHIAQEVDGSAAIIAVIEGKKVMLTCKLNGSPLYFAEAQGVRIAASTRKAVEECADAMGLELVGQRITKTVEVKGKKTTTTETVEKIELAKEGRVLSWNEGQHNMMMVPVPTQTYKKPWRGGSSQYGDASYGYGNGGLASVNGRNGYWREGEWSWYPQADRSKPKNPPKPVADYEVSKQELAAREAARKVVTPQAIRSLTPTQQPTTPAGHTGGTTTVKSATPTHQRVDGFLYPLGTPEPNTPEYEALQRIFLLWRKSGHGLKWARENVSAAHNYDSAVVRTSNHGKLPPFPTPRELAAMHADPLFEKQLDQVPVKERHLAGPPTPAGSREGAGFVADSCGVVTVATDEAMGKVETSYDAIRLDMLVRRYAAEMPDLPMREIVDIVLDELDADAATEDRFKASSPLFDDLHGLPSDATLDQIVSHMLATRGVEHTGGEWGTCDLCGEEVDDLEPIDGEQAEACGDCKRMWLWSDSVA